MKGFTLVEIIIVVSIILTLAVLGVESYAVARRSMVIDLTTDKLVQALYSSREQAKNSAKCTGMRFETNKMPQNIEADYKNPVDGCENDFEVSSATWTKETQIYALLLDSDQKESFDVVFIPPLGQIKLPDGFKNAEIILSLKNQTNSRKIILSSLTGKIEKLLNNATR
ncbi:MAG: prepilin-type N-terminal cleavage/methylation domain-containing protein [Candidatus Gracilibacteria bacterium]|jgi:prepilin-type N-terminal cleavage/methylation domain-containing protein